MITTMTARTHPNLYAALTAHHRPATELVDLVDTIRAVWPGLDQRPDAAARVLDLCAHELDRRTHHPVPLFHEGQS